MSKLQVISDKNKQSSKIKNLLLKKIKSSHFKKDHLVIVIGGNGFMLKTHKKNKNSNLIDSLVFLHQTQHIILDVILTLIHLQYTLK